MKQIRRTTAFLCCLVTVAVYSKDKEIFDPNAEQRFRVREIYLGMTIDELRELTDNNKHRVFRNCKEKRNYDFGYMYCSHNEAGFRFDKNGNLTRFWFGISQAERLFGKKFKSQNEYLAFVKTRFRIKSFNERDGRPQIHSITGNSTIPRIYAVHINRSYYLEVNEISTLTIGKGGPDRPIRFD